jgi:transcriptional regulator with XRE-family HTH domain
MAQEKSTPSKQPFGIRLRERRTQIGLTQRELAGKVGLSPGAIGRMESEAKYVSARPTIIALAHALACDVDWLATGETAQGPTPKGQLGPDDLAVAKRLYTLRAEIICDYQDRLFELTNALIDWVESGMADDSVINERMSDLRERESPARKAAEELTAAGHKAPPIESADDIWKKFAKSKFLGAAIAKTERAKHRPP